MKKDIYPRTIERFITLRGKADSSGLGHVVGSVAAECLALQRSRGYSHGNLKTSNVYLAGRRRALRQVTIRLGDPDPAAAAQPGRPEAGLDRSGGGLLRQTIEAQDLRAIGELIFQLVEGRIIRSGENDYPIRPSPAWETLGKDAGRWLELCNRLLDPNLSLEQLSLEMLAREFRPGAVAVRLPLLLALLGAIGLLGAGVFLAMPSRKPAPQSTRMEPPPAVEAAPQAMPDAKKQERADHQSKFKLAMAGGEVLLGQGSYLAATNEFASALGLAAKLGDEAGQQAADQRLRYAQALASAEDAGRGGRVDEEIHWLEMAVSNRSGLEPLDAKVDEWLTGAKHKVDEAKAQQAEAARLALQQRQQLAEAKAEAEAAERALHEAEARASQAEAARLALEQQKQEAERQRQGKISDDLQTARTALESGRIADARKQFQAVLVLDETNAQAQAGLADAARAEQAVAARVASAATNNTVSTKKFAGVWKGSVDYKNILVGGIHSMTVIINADETAASASSEYGTVSGRRTTLNGDKLSFKTGLLHEETFLMTLSPNANTANVTLTTLAGTGFGELKKQ